MTLNKLIDRLIQVRADNPALADTAVYCRIQRGERTTEFVPMSMVSSSLLTVGEQRMVEVFADKAIIQWPPKRRKA